MTAVGYVRVSTEDHVKEGLGLDNQKSKIKAYCELKDLKLREVIEDAGMWPENPWREFELGLALELDDKRGKSYDRIRPSVWRASACLRLR